jgi:hypothetical protein
MERPQCGWFLLRLTRGAVEVAASIQYERTEHEPDCPENRMDRPSVLTGRINGEVCDWREIWHSRTKEITEADYKFLLAERAWALKYAPNDPAAADPHKPLDLRSAPMPF